MFSMVNRFWPRLFAVASLLVLCTALVGANDYWGRSGGRYYYGQRNSHFYYGPYWGQQRNCYTYYYYYLPPDENAYSYHTAVYYPQDVGAIRGNYYYYKNHRTGKWWGRCHPDSSDYELLAPPDQKETLVGIPEKAFVAQGKMPPVPGMGNAAPPLIPPPQPTEPPKE